MSLSTDVRDAFSKPHGMRNFSEHHPMLITLAVVAGFLTAYSSRLFVGRGSERKTAPHFSWNRF